MEPHRCTPTSSEPAGRRSKRPMYEEPGDSSDDEDTGEIRAGKNWSSARKVNMVVSKFNELKRNLVRNTGFGGLLDLPLFNKVDRKFTIWLLSRVDCLRRVIVVNGEDQTDIVDMDVKRILGIPCGNLAVCGLNLEESATEFEFRSLKVAKAVVKKDYPNGMDKDDMDKFKVAFVVFAIGTFLAPTCRYNSVNPDFFGALVNIDDISKYNWAAYVLDHLMEAAAKVQEDLRSKRDVSNITGCSLLIQIIYLDSLRLAPSLRPPANCNPRVKAYDCEMMRKLILTDKASSSGYTDSPSWGCSQPRLRKVSSTQVGRNHTSSTIGVNTAVHQDRGQPPRDAEANDLLQHLHILPTKLSEVLRQHCGSKLSQQQVSALRWYQASTTRLINQLSVSLINAQISLVEKLANATPPRGVVDASRKQMSNSAGLDGYASGTESATEVVQPNSVVATSKRNQQPQGPIDSPGNPACPTGNAQVPGGLLGNINGNGNKDARPANSCPLLNQSSPVMTPVAAARPTSSCMTTGHNCDPPPFDLGFNDDVAQSVDPFTPNLPKTSADKQGATIGKSPQSMTPVPSGRNNIGAPAECYPSPIVPVPQLQVTPLTSIAAIAAKPISYKLPIDGPAFRTPEHFIRNTSATPAELNELMAYSGVFARILEAESPSNKDHRAWDEEFTDTPPTKCKVVEGKIVKSHWFCGYEHPKRQLSLLAPLWSTLCDSSKDQLDRIWVQHQAPTPVHMSGHDMKTILCNGAAMSHQFCDVAMRSFIQLDTFAYPEGADVRWRHFLESDFAMFAISGENTWKSKVIQNQFIGEQVTYQLNRCRMIIIPALVTLTWCCYFFDFKEKCVHIVDPTFRAGTEALMDQLHGHSAAKLQAALANCIQEFFEGWTPDWNGWSRKYVPAMHPKCSTMESGIQMLVAARDYDGSKLVNRYSPEMIEGFKKGLLYELMSLRGNEAKLPNSYIHSLDD